MAKTIDDELNEHIKVIELILAGQKNKIEEIANLIIGCYKNNGKLVIFGNGGSAADAQHIAAELVGKYKLERKSLSAIALTTNLSAMSAIGNDYDFSQIFERQIDGLVTEKDVVIGISTSGDSENIIKGILRAKEIGAKTIVFTGENGGKIKDIPDLLLSIPSKETPRIQEAHITCGHIICGLVEEKLFNQNGLPYQEI